MLADLILLPPERDAIEFDPAGGILAVEQAGWKSRQGWLFQPGKAPGVSLMAARPLPRCIRRIFRPTA